MEFYLIKHNDFRIMYYIWAKLTYIINIHSSDEVMEMTCNTEMDQTPATVY
jgi:hypothetical protein